MYTFPHISSYTNPSVPRLKKAAEAIFKQINNTTGSKGILVGGAAAVFLTSSRQTKDLDINVTRFPSLRGVDPNFIYDRPGSSELMRKMTYKRNDILQSVKCDVSVVKAKIVATVYNKHVVTIPGLEGVAVADPDLLLADKICTFAERLSLGSPKSGRDIKDIEHCIQFMFAYDRKMDPVLQGLYTAEQWIIVRDLIAKDLATVAEDEIGVIKKA